MNGLKGALVVGSDGLIGRALFRRLAAAGCEVLGTTRRADEASEWQLPLDLNRDVSSWQPPANCPVAFLCAAITSLEECRRDPQGTRRVNVENTFAIAQKLLEAGTFVIFLSTNLVFDGTTPSPRTTDAPNPAEEYGRQKVAAEGLLLGLDGQVAVVRLSKVFHGEMPLVRKWTEALRRGEAIFPLNDLRCSPISLDFVLSVLEKVGCSRFPGIFQVSGELDLTYADIAMRLARRLNVDSSMVQPRSAKELNLALSHLPIHTTMDVSGTVSELGLKPPAVWTVVDSVLSQLSEA